MSGDVNPAHVDADFAKSDMFHKVIAHGMWGGALISAVLGTELPGPGTIYLNQNLSFRRAVGLGDTVTVRVTVADAECRTPARDAGLPVHQSERRNRHRGSGAWSSRRPTRCAAPVSPCPRFICTRAAPGLTS